MKKVFAWTLAWPAFFVRAAWFAAVVEFFCVRAIWPGLSRFPLHGAGPRVVAAYFVQNVLADAAFMLAVAGVVWGALAVVRKKSDGVKRRAASRAGALAACFFILAFTPVNFGLFGQAFFNVKGLALNAVLFAAFVGAAFALHRLFYFLDRRPALRRFNAATATAAVASAAAFWAFFIIAGASAPSGVGPSGAGRPNVLVLLIDACRTDALSCYGGVMPTPNVAGLAARGVVFDNAFTTVPNTNRAVMSIFTSRSPTVHGATVTNVAAAAIPTLAEVLSQEGYDCEAIIGNAVLRPDIGYGRGFTRYTMAWDPIKIRWLDYTTFPSSYRRVLQRLVYANEQMPITDTLTEDVVAYLKGSDARKPFFLYAHYLDPHNPYTPPPAYIRPPLPLRDEALVKLGKDARNIRTYKPEDADVLKTLYMAEVAYVDDRLADIFAAMDEQDLWRDTMVVVLADHGEAFGEHGAMDHHVHYNDVLQIPLIIKAPSGPLSRPGRYEGAVSILDLAPTVYAFAGVAAPAGLEGTDLAALLMQPDLERFVYAEGRINHDDPISIHSRKYAVIKNATAGTLEVYDRDADADELHNLAVSDAVLAAALEAVLSRRREDVARHAAASGGTLEFTGSEKKKVKSLGYLND